MIIGPCSIHHIDSAKDYAQRLATLRTRYQHRLEIVMRTYFEKPRTVVGWKGLIADPQLNGSFLINEGLMRARQLLLDINALGLPTATEFLDIVTGQYIADTISWGAIGALYYPHLKTKTSAAAEVFPFRLTRRDQAITALSSMASRQPPNQLDRASID